MNTAKKIIVHHTNGVVANAKADTAHHTVYDIDQWHKTRWPGFTSKRFKNKDGRLYHCGYHFVIEKDGTTTQTRGLTETGAHCVGMNNSSIGVCLTGNYDSLYPTEAQHRAFVNLFKRLKADLPHLTVYDIVPHRTYSSKSCFGSNLTDDYFQGVVMQALDQPERESERDERAQRTLMFKIIELLQTQIAILTQQITDKRMKI